MHPKSDDQIYAFGVKWGGLSNDEHPAAIDHLNY